MVGTNDLRGDGTYYNADKIIMHEGYNQPRFANDIGLVRIRETIKFTDHVKSIDYSSEEVPDGADLQLTGWGATRAGGRLPQLLQIITLKAVSTKRCREIYGNSNNVHDSHICTFNGRGQGACNVSSALKKKRK